MTNLITGMANALIDCCPVVAFGGSSPISQFGRQVFQEIDQVELMRGCCKQVDRVHNLKRIPQQVNFALQHAMTGKPGPVYVDMPGDILYRRSTRTGGLELCAAADAWTAVRSAIRARWTRW